MKIIGCSGGMHLARPLSRILGAELVPVESRLFPDGELYVRIAGDVSGDVVAIVQSTGRAPNRLLMELLLTLETAKELGAERAVCVIPYFPYARQDSRFKPGEAISFGIVARMLERAGMDALVTVDLHLHRRKPEDVFRVPVENVTAMVELARYFSSKVKLDNPVAVAPDEEAEQWVRVFARELGVEYTVMLKERRGDEAVEITWKGADVSGRDAVIVDDIISTGSTIRAATEQLLSAGAKRVFAACTHAILAYPAEYKLSKVDDVVASDTVPSPYTRVSVARPLAEGIKKVVSRWT